MGQRGSLGQKGPSEPYHRLVSKPGFAPQLCVYFECVCSYLLVLETSCRNRRKTGRA